MVPGLAAAAGVLLTVAVVIGGGSAQPSIGGPVVLEERQRPSPSADPGRAARAGRGDDGPRHDDGDDGPRHDDGDDD